MTWLAEAPHLDALLPQSRAQLAPLQVRVLPKGTPLFSPGDPVRGYAIVLSGQISVHLIGPTGREIVLYTVAPGQSCIQSTLGLLGDDPYSAEAEADTDVRLVMLPRAVFLALIDEDPGFRKQVFASFASRMQAMMQLLEKLSFQRVEGRLAACLVARAHEGTLEMTQAALAAEIGSAREVVSRRLDGLAKRGIVRIERGRITLMDVDALREIARFT